MEKQSKNSKKTKKAGNDKSLKIKKVTKKTTKTTKPKKESKATKVTKTPKTTKATKNLKSLKTLKSLQTPKEPKAAKTPEYPIELMQDNLRKSDKSSFCCYYPKGKESLVVATSKKTDYSISFDDDLVSISMPEENFNISANISELQIVTNNKHSVLYIEKINYNEFKIITNSYIKLPYLKIANKSSQANFIETVIDKEILSINVVNDIIEFIYRDASEKSRAAQSEEDDDIEDFEDQEIDEDPILEEVIPPSTPEVEKPSTPPSQAQAKVEQPIPQPAPQFAQPRVEQQPCHISFSAIPSTPERQFTESIPTVPAHTGDITDNNELLISESAKKVFLPYTVKDLNKKLNSNSKYKNLEDVINSEYIIPTERYKSPTISRFREAYNLIKKKEHGTIKEALDLGFELMLQSNLHPAIISACKNLDELDIYLDCLDDNDVNSFSCFNIKYDVPPKAKH